jgi:hypothetical protein
MLDELERTFHVLAVQRQVTLLVIAKRRPAPRRGVGQLNRINVK